MLRPLNDNLLRCLQRDTGNVLLFRGTSNLRHLHVNTNHFTGIYHVAINLSINLITRLFRNFLHVRFLYDISDTRGTRRPFRVNPNLSMSRIRTITTNTIQYGLVLYRRHFGIPYRVNTKNGGFRVVFFLQVGGHSATRGDYTGMHASTNLATSGTKVSLRTNLTTHNTRRLIRPNRLLQHTSIRFVRRTTKPLLIRSLTLRTTTYRRLLNDLRHLLLLNLRRRALYVGVFNGTHGTVDYHARATVLLSTTLHSLLPHTKYGAARASSGSIDI